MAAMVLRLQGAHRLGESLTQVDDRRWSLQKVCETLARVAGSEIVMLIKSDVQEYGYLRRYTACIFICVDSLSEMIGRVRPEAVVLNNASLHLRVSRSQQFSIKKLLF